MVGGSLLLCGCCHMIRPSNLVVWRFGITLCMLGGQCHKSFTFFLPWILRTISSEIQRVEVWCNFIMDRASIMYKKVLRWIAKIFGIWVVISLVHGRIFTSSSPLTTCSRFFPGLTCWSSTMKWLGDHTHWSSSCYPQMGETLQWPLSSRPLSHFGNWRFDLEPTLQGTFPNSKLE